MNAQRYERIRQIFLQACRVPAGEQAALLDEACWGEPDLRAEIEALLEHDRAPVEAVAQVSDGGGMEMLARAIGEDDERLLTEMPGRIGGYAILGVIGEGGMGVVYEAEQQDPRRRVALKVIRPGMVTRGLLRRFRHEAQVLGQLQHPGIARIYEAGTEDRGEGGQPFFAMELIEGRPLLEYAEAHRLGTRDRLVLIAAICNALHHAHQKGVIHRDLKPANVLIDETGQPKVLDFGVARATDADLQTITLRTDVGQFVGTVPYMSPEQASGEPDVLDTRSDVYSLGVVAFELLTDRLPYPVAGKMIHEAVRVIREEEPSRLSSIDRSLRGDVETIVAKALEKDRDRRYQSAAELAADIRRYLADEPIIARPASSLYQLRKFARRNKALVGGAAAVLAVSIAGTVVSARYAIIANRNAVALADRERAARWQSYKASLVAAAGELRGDNPKAAAAYLDGAPPEHRGWEWKYVHARLTTHVLEWPVPPPRVYSSPVFSHDGSRMFCFLADATIGEWDAATGALVATHAVNGGAPKGSYGRLNTVSRRYAAQAEGGGIVVGDPGTGEVLAELAGFETPAVPLAWDAPGERLLFNADKKLWMWDGESARVIAEVDHYRAAFSRSGDRIFSANSTKGACLLLDADTGAVLAHRGLPGDYANCVAFAPDDRTIAVGGKYRNVFLLDAETLDIKLRLAGHRKVVDDLAFAPDGATVLSSSRDGTLRVWDVQTGTPTQVFETGESDWLLCAFLPGRNDVLALGDHIRQYELGEGAARVLRGHESYVYYAAFSPDGSMIASTTYGDGTIRLWDANAAVEIARFDAPEPGWYHYRVPTAQFSADGARLASGNSSGALWVDLATGASVRVEGDSDWVHAITVARGQEAGTRVSPFGAYSPDGSLFVTASTVPGVPFRAYRDRIAGDVAYELDHAVNTVAFSPDGRVLATTVPDGTVRLYDAATGAPRGRLVGGVGPAYAVAFHPTEPRIATGGEDGIVRIWDAATCEQLLELRGHDQYVMDLLFSPDGTMLVSASGDYTLRIWDTLPRAEREQRAKDAAALRERMRERVGRLLGELGTPASVAEAIRSDGTLSDAQRRAALRVLLEMRVGSELEE